MLTKEQYEETKQRLATYNEWVKQFVKPNGWIIIPNEAMETCPVVMTNDDRSAMEVYEFVNDPPTKYFLYVDLDKRIVTTWTGDTLGTITWAGREFRSGFGDKRVPINIKGINGKRYYGTYYKSSGSYARIKEQKGA